MYLKEQIKKRMKNEKGLTLVELLAVIVILGIIAAIAIPSIGNIIANSRAKAVIADAQNVLNAANLYFTDNADKQKVLLDTDGTTEGLVDKGFLESAGSIETATITKNSGGNTIEFTAKVNGKATAETIKAVTLEQLNKATVEKGVITIPKSTVTTVGEQNEQKIGVKP